MLVTIVNFIIERLLHLDGGIRYHWYTALPTALVICVFLYPIILWAKKTNRFFLEEILTLGEFYRISKLLF